MPSYGRRFEVRLETHILLGRPEPTLAHEGPKAEIVLQTC
jgi:hypothetical protein